MHTGALLLEPSMTIKHEELVEICKRGDSSAYTALYNSCSKEVYNSIYRLLNNRAESEDILQETFVAAFQAIHKFEHTGGFKAWTKRIAINKSIDLLRKKKKMRFVEMDTGNVHLEEDDKFDESGFSFRVDEIRKAIEELPDGYRTIVQLHVFESFTHVEIGNMLGLTGNNVKIQYHRAKLRIMKALTKRGLL